MKYKTGSAFRRALEDRLRGNSLGSGLPLIRLRKLVTFDRLLARLHAASPEAWVLMGGFALQLRFGVRSRTTKDLDLLMRDTSLPAWDMLRQAGSTDLGDWFGFEVGSPQSEPMEDQPGGQRFSVRSLLDGRSFETFHVDVGSGDPIVEQPEILETSELLAFAGIAPVPFPTYPLTQQIAEKLHAYTRLHHGIENTRVRDLVDILLIASQSRLDGRNLAAAIQATFSARSTHLLPDRLPNPPSKWESSFRSSARELGLEWKDLGAATEAAKAFLNPIMAGNIAGRWDPAAWSWS